VFSFSDSSRGAFLQTPGRSSPSRKRSGTVSRPPRAARDPVLNTCAPCRSVVRSDRHRSAFPFLGLAGGAIVGRGVTVRRSWSERPASRSELSGAANNGNTPPLDMPASARGSLPRARSLSPQIALEQRVVGGAMLSISSWEYFSERAWYSAGKSTSSYPGLRALPVEMATFFAKRLMIPWNSGPSPTGSPPDHLAVLPLLDLVKTRSKSACSLSIRETNSTAAGRGAPLVPHLLGPHLVPRRSARTTTAASAAYTPAQRVARKVQLTLGVDQVDLRVPPLSTAGQLMEYLRSISRECNR